ncbi:MAG: T9SS type A sorting domain-containing protein [Bacteroidia bacterium]|jgi:hypothetical protein|nr:T9SS type A sorting domain-containing protein [Bacteroidia bacterium]
MKKITLLFSFALLIIVANAQSYYYIKHFYNAGNPGKLNTEADNVNTGWSVLSNTAANPSFSANQNLPFTFNFNNAPVTAYKVSTTGYLTFETTSTTPAHQANLALPSDSLPNNTIHIGGISTSGSNDQVLSKVFGTAPNRQLWIRFFSSTTPGNAASFSYYAIVLEETTNKIYIVNQFYGTGTLPYVSPSTNIGIQVSKTDATIVTPAPQLNNTAQTAWYTELPEDNNYYEFIYGSQPANSARVLTFNLSSRLGLNAAPYTLSGSLLNTGSAAINNVQLNYSINNGTPISALVNVSAAVSSNANISHPTTWTPTSAGKYNVKYWISEVNGVALAANDVTTLTVDADVFSAVVDKKVLHEIFTSSTCPPCAPGNANLKSILNQASNLNKWNVIKYQMNFPGTGDPYYTTEAGTRFNYYGAEFAPWLTVDGGFNDNANSYTDELFNNALKVKTPFSITAGQSWGADGKTINITGTVTVPEAVQGNYRIHIAVVERTTVLNVKTNGETEFSNVMKKMLPNASGTVANFATTTSIPFSQSWTVPGNFRLPSDGQEANIINLSTENSVENFWNLTAIVFLQDQTTKEVLQSMATAQVYPLGTQKIEAIEAELFPNPTSQNFTLKFKDNTTGTIKITSLDGKVIYTSTIEGLEQTVNCDGLNNGLYFVEITANGSTSVQKLMIAK